MNPDVTIERFRLDQIRSALKELQPGVSHDVIDKTILPAQPDLQITTSLRWLICWVDPTEGSHIGDDEWRPADYLTSQDAAYSLIKHQFPKWKIVIEQDVSKIRETQTHCFIRPGGGEFVHERVRNHGYGNGWSYTIAASMVCAYADARIRQIDAEDSK